MIKPQASTPIRPESICKSDKSNENEVKYLRKQNAQLLKQIAMFQQQQQSQMGGMQMMGHGLNPM